jgi:hypothetical protein
MGTTPNVLVQKHYPLIIDHTFYTLSHNPHLSQKITLHPKDAPSHPLQPGQNHFSLQSKMKEIWPNGTNATTYYKQVMAHIQNHTNTKSKHKNFTNFHLSTEKWMMIKLE